MGKQTADLHINPSEETIGLGLLVVRFLLTGTTRLAATRPLSSLSRGAQRLAAPAHSHDH